MHLQSLAQVKNVGGVRNSVTNSSTLSTIVVLMIDRFSCNHNGGFIFFIFSVIHYF